VPAVERDRRVACYRNHPITPEDVEARPGETIRLAVEGQVLGTTVWTAHGERQWRPLGKVDRWEVYLPLIQRE